MLKSVILLLTIVILCLGRECDIRPFPTDLAQIADLNVQDQIKIENFFQPTLQAKEDYTEITLPQDSSMEIKTDSENIRVMIGVVDTHGSQVGEGENSVLVNMKKGVKYSIKWNILNVKELSMNDCLKVFVSITINPINHMEEFYAESSFDDTNNNGHILCKLPIIPTTLDTIAFLDYSNFLHIFGQYFVNYHHLEHAITFTLTSPSAFRIVAQDNNFIRTTVYLSEPGGSLINSVKANGVSSIYQYLNEGVYQIYFMFTPLPTTSDSDCVFVEFELEITPITDIKNSQCVTSNPLSELPQPFQVNYPVDYSYTSQNTVNSIENGYFWSYQLSVGDFPAHVKPVIKIDVEYEFVIGKLMVILERKTNSHCNSQDAISSSNCVTGQNYKNHHSLKALVDDNEEYTIWLYLPNLLLPQITGCFNYSFSLSIVSEVVQENYWNCGASRPPAVLSSPEYLSESGNIHFVDDFYIPSSNYTMTLEVTKTSFFRMSILSPSPISVYYHTSTNFTASDYTNSLNYLSSALILEPNTYFITLTAWVQSDTSNFCATSSFEVAMEPVTLFQEIHPPESLPDTSQFEGISAPYQFGIPSEFAPPLVYTAYYSNHPDNLIFSFDLDLDEDTETIIQVESSYLYNNVYIKIENQLLGVSLRSSNSFNLQSLRVKLVQGNYKVSVLMDTPFPGATAASFTFQLVLLEVNPCSDVSGEFLPRSLNSIRFLRSSNEVSYNYNSYLAPPDFHRTKNSLSTTSFSVDELSIFRVYINPSNSLAISISLTYFDLELGDEISVYHSKPENTARSQSFVVQVKPDYNYYLRLTFTERKRDDCPLFQFQFAIGPIDPLPPSCPSANKLPDYFPPYLPQTPYHYDSQRGDELYFQQVAGEDFITYLPFKFYNYGNIHLEVTYDFLTSDLYVRVEDIHQNAIYRAEKSDGRTVIHLVGLPPNTYAIVLAQKANDNSILGCSYFTYKITIQQYTPQKLNLLPYQYVPLPDTLNSIGYLDYYNALQYNEEVYFSDSHNYILFNITTPSYLRLNTQNQQRIKTVVTIRSSDSSDSLVFYGSNPAISVNPGSYKIDLAPSIANTVHLLQIEIEKQSKMNNLLAQRNYEFPGCPTTALPIIPLIRRNSTYQYSRDDLTLSYYASRDPIMRFSIEDASYVFFHTGFQNLPDKLTLLLASADGSVALPSYSYQLNSAEIYTFIPAGEYTVTLQFNVFPISHCILYSLTVVISSQPQSVECFNIYSIPYDLNDPDAGSALYGGPIDNDGFLFFRGPSFAIYDITNHVSFISFDLEKPSLVVIITNSDETPVQFDIINRDQSLAIPIYSSSSDGFTQLIFDLTHSNYTIQLYDFGDRISECASYSLTIDIAPADSITNPPNCFQPSLPASNLYFEDRVANDWKESFLPVYLFNQTFTTKFTLSESYDLHCILSFNIFKSMGKFSIYRNNRKIFTSTSYTPSPFSTLTNTITEYTTTLFAGDYSIELRFDQYNYLNGESFDCFPYTWNLQLTPHTNSPTISSVNPPSSNYILPYATITLDITFDSSVYANGSILSNSNNQPILDSIYLGVIEGSNTMNQSPSSAINLDLLAIVWRVEFTGRFLVPGENYILSLHSGILTDEQLLPFTLQTVHIYRVLPQCSEFEHYNLTTFQCECNEGYKGDHCDECAEGYMGFPCQPLDYCYPVCVNGECVLQQCNCSMGWAGDACNYCDDHFTGDLCDECNNGWAGPTCSSCAPHFTGDNCDRCEDHFTGPNCDQCAVGWAGADCNRCDDHFTGPDCNICKVGWAGTSCSVCNPRFTGPNCDTCAYPFTGDQCDQCAGHFEGFNCAECEVGWAGDDCSSCALHFTGDQCDQCELGWTGPSCDSCDDHFTGFNCDQCSNQWYGDHCEICPINFQSNPGDCSLCSSNFEGDDCSRCTSDWTGVNCSIPVDVLTQDTHVIESTDVDTPLDNRNIILNTLIIGAIIFALIVFLAIAFVCILKKRKSTSATMRVGLPTLDLDEESGIEMDLNPVLPRRNEDENRNDFGRFSWNNPEDNNNLISFNIGSFDEAENEFDGALDLDDLDDFDPRANENSTNNANNNDDFDDFDPRATD